MNEAYLFNHGENVQAYRYLGSFHSEQDGLPGWIFRVWAPKASRVSVVGQFNDWTPDCHPLHLIDQTGIWEGFIPGLAQWERYKYAVTSATGKTELKADPFARHAEERPGTASILYEMKPFKWTDDEFLKNCPAANESQPLNIYEVHLPSWRRYPDGNLYNYREIAVQLAAYCVEMGYNCVEIMPITEYPLDDSWGYQVTGYFAPTARNGTPEDFCFFVNHLHEQGIRIILDWVPAHFPKDSFGLARFDGSPCFEHPDSRLGEHKEWGTLVFDYSKAEVRSFLLSSAWFWLAEFHLDGLRVDAVSAMVYLDYGRKDWLPNKFGGKENLDCIAFLRELNRIVHQAFPHCFMVAEESTAFPFVTKSVSEGGLGFTHKWNMGWMHDVLDYMSIDHYARGNRHNQMSFSLTYAFSENYVLPLSHDEVVHGKRSLIGRMPGDIWRQFAGMRTLVAWQIGHPGGKLNFMGSEFAQFIEWRFYEELQWFMLKEPAHKQIHDFTRHMNHFYLSHPALWDNDRNWSGFEWLQADDYQNSVFAYVRKSREIEQNLIFIFNLTPKSFEEYRLRVPYYGRYRLLMNSDDLQWGGSAFLGDKSEGMVFSTTPDNYEDFLKDSARELGRLRTVREEAVKTAEDLQRLRLAYAKLIRELMSFGANANMIETADAPCIDPDKPLPKVPELMERLPENPMLSLKLPPLSVLILELCAGNKED